MTLVEVLFAIWVLVLSGLGLLASYQANLHLSEVSQQTGMALNDLKDMMERIKATSFTNLQANFPSGAPNGVVGGGAEKYSPIIGGYTLSNEQITVQHQDPVTHQASVIADPRELVVQLSWTNRGRTYQRSVMTIRASRAS